MRIHIPALVALLFLSPVHAAPGDLQTATDLLEDPARAAVEAVPDSVDDKRSADAFAAGAYLSAITLAADALVMPEQERLWDEAQNEPDPGLAFLQSVADTWEAVRTHMQDALDLLDDASETVHVGDAGRLLVAAHLLVEAELGHDLTGRFLTGSGQPEYVRTADQRYSFLRPVMVAEAKIKAADHLLHAEPTREGTVLDVQFIDAEVSRRGGALPSEFLFEESGPLHRLARHVSIYESTVGNATVDQLRDALTQMESARASWPDAAPQARAATVSQDVSWWLGRAASEYDSEGLWAPLLATLHGYVRGAEYEADLLAEAAPDEASVPWLGISMGVGALAVGAAGVFALQRVRRNKALSALAWAPILAVALAVLPHLPMAEAEPLPASPVQTAVAFTLPDPMGAWGGLSVDEDDMVRFTWIACPPPESTGCYDIWSRSYDPASTSWSDPVRLYDGPTDVSIPRLFPSAQGDHLVWLQKDTPDGATLLKWCSLDAGCAPVTLSDAGADAGNAVGIVGPDGKFRVAWQEEFPSTARIVFRMHDGSSWKAPVLFETTNPAQRFPSLAVDSTGRSHLAWQQTGAPANKNAAYRTMHYGTVDAAGSAATHAERVTFPGIDVLTRPSVAVSDDDIVGLAFNNLRDTYFMEKKAGDAAWGDAVNVTRTNSFSTQSAVRLMPIGDDWVVTYRTGSIGEMRFWRADRADGLWLTPQIAVDNPFGEYLLMPTVAGDAHGIHLAWSGYGPGASDIQMHYRLLAPEPPGIPPVIKTHKPAPDTWVRDPDVQFLVRFEASAPLDMEQTRLTVDGAPIPLHKDTLLNDPVLAATATGLSDGPHQAALTVVDVHGRSTQTGWAFQKDSIAPRLDLTWRAGGVESDPTGWQTETVTLEATADENGGGSPAHVEVSIDDGATYFPLTEAAVALGMMPSGDGWALPEGRMMDLRLRAKDGAGNVDASPRRSVGWDATAPFAVVEVPAWTNTAAQAVVATDVGGSPVTTTLRLLDGTTMVAEATIEGIGNTTLPAGEGMYTLHAQVMDEAGNRMDPAPGPWQVGIDATAPLVSLSGSTLDALDAASGLARIEMRSGDNLVLLEEPNGTAQQQVHVPWPEGVTRLRTVVTDVAGNQWSGDLDRVQGALPDPEKSTSGQETSDRSKEQDEDAPGPAFLWILASVTVALYLRRRT